MTRVDVHPASLSDIPQLCRLYFDFHEFHAAGLPERLVSLGSWEAYDLAVGSPPGGNHQSRCQNSGRVLGFVEIYLRQEEPDPARAAFVYAHLQSLMVAPGWRKQGIGKRLVQAAETWAAGKGAAEVRLDTWEFPGDPVKFYEGVGYRTLKRKLVRRL
jgi:GNAT superfamily N-acetyltransferase